MSAVARMKPVSAIHSLSASSLPSSFVFNALLHAKPVQEAGETGVCVGGWVCVNKCSTLGTSLLLQ